MLVLLKCALVLFASLSVSFARAEASPKPGGAADGGRGGASGLVLIRASNLDGSEIASASVEVPGEGMSGYYAFKRSSIKWDSQMLGGKSVVTTIGGVGRAFDSSSLGSAAHTTRAL